MQINRWMIGFVGLAVLTLCAAPAFADSTYTFSLLPTSGEISGPAGTPIGWGYSITNDSSVLWLVTVNLTSSPFADGTADASPFDFPILAPDTTATLMFDPIADTGLFALTWDGTAPLGFTNTGVFTLSAQFWSGDPFTTGTFLEDAPDETAAYSATVGPATTPPPTAPEPASALLLATGIAALAFGLRRRGNASPACSMRS